MSGNRANAAARSRRAAGEMPPPPQQMQGRGGRPGQQQQQQYQVPQEAPKQMTIQNAIALITLRLSRVETIVQKIDTVEQPNSTDENDRIIDNGVFDNIVSRLEALERGHKLLATKNVTTTVVNNDSTDKFSESIAVLQAELTFVKDLLLKLQTFTMNTNQKLVDIVVGADNDEDSDVGMNRQIVFMQSEDFINDNDDDNATVNTNLKELQYLLCKYFMFENFFWNYQFPKKSLLKHLLH